MLQNDGCPTCMRWCMVSRGTQMTRPLRWMRYETCCQGFPGECTVHVFTSGYVLCFYESDKKWNLIFSNVCWVRKFLTYSEYTINYWSPLEYSKLPFIVLLNVLPSFFYKFCMINVMKKEYFLNIYSVSIRCMDYVLAFQCIPSRGHYYDVPLG